MTDRYSRYIDRIKKLYGGLNGENIVAGDDGICEGTRNELNNFIKSAVKYLRFAGDCNAEEIRAAHSFLAAFCDFKPGFKESAELLPDSSVTLYLRHKDFDYIIMEQAVSVAAQSSAANLLYTAYANDYYSPTVFAMAMNNCVSSPHAVPPHIKYGLYFMNRLTIGDNTLVEEYLNLCKLPAQELIHKYYDSTRIEFTYIYDSAVIDSICSCRRHKLCDSYVAGASYRVSDMVKDCVSNCRYCYMELMPITQDPNAVRLVSLYGYVLGYVPRKDNRDIAAGIRGGKKFFGEISVVNDNLSLSVFQV